MPAANGRWPTTRTCVTAGCRSSTGRCRSWTSSINLLNDPFIEQILIHEDSRQLAYRRGPLVFVFNFHPTESYTNLRIPVPDPKDYKVILDTDEARFGGFGRVVPGVTYPKQDVPDVRPAAERADLPAQPQRTGAGAV